MILINAHYGENRPGNKAAILLEWKQWVLRQLGPPTELSASFIERPDGLKEQKSYRNKKYQDMLVDEARKGNVSLLQMISMATTPKGYKMFDWDWEVTIGVADMLNGPICTLGIDLKQLQQEPPFLIQEYEKLSRPILGTEYGFAAIMPREFMPAGYAIGLGCTGATEEIGDDAASWGRGARKECGHVIRNVFGYNVLNSKHLDIDVGGVRLEDWIGVSADRGRIEPLGDGLFLWTFQHGEDQMDFLQWDYSPVVKVREELQKFNIFPWQKFRERMKISPKIEEK